MLDRMRRDGAWFQGAWLCAALNLPIRSCRAPRNGQRSQSSDDDTGASGGAALGVDLLLPQDLEGLALARRRPRGRKAGRGSAPPPAGAASPPRPGTGGSGPGRSRRRRGHGVALGRAVSGRCGLERQERRAWQAGESGKPCGRPGRLVNRAPATETPPGNRPVGPIAVRSTL